MCVRIINRSQKGENPRNRSSTFVQLMLISPLIEMNIWIINMLHKRWNKKLNSWCFDVNLIPGKRIMQPSKVPIFWWWNPTIKAKERIETMNMTCFNQYWFYQLVLFHFLLLYWITVNNFVKTIEMILAHPHLPTWYGRTCIFFATILGIAFLVSYQSLEWSADANSKLPYFFQKIGWITFISHFCSMINNNNNNNKKNGI